MNLFAKLKKRITKKEVIPSELLVFGLYNFGLKDNLNFISNSYKKEIYENSNWVEVKNQIDFDNLEKYNEKIISNINIMVNFDKYIKDKNDKYITHCIDNNITPNILIEILKEDISHLFNGNKFIEEDEFSVLLEKYNFEEISEFIKCDNASYFMNSIGNNNIYTLFNLKDKIKLNNEKYKNRIENINSEESKEKSIESLFSMNTYISNKEKELIIKNNNIKEELFEQINDLVKTNNENFIKNNLLSESTYLDNILKVCDPNIKLDLEQRIAILSDEDYTLVIAGAGAGKTTTVSAKVKYLVEKKNIDPSEILVISFTNKAVDELKQRINTELGVPCPITTFHSTGNAIIRKTTSEKATVVSEGYLFNTIRDYIKSDIMTNPLIIEKMILFFSYHINLDLEANSIDEAKKKLMIGKYQTLKSSVSEINEELINDKAKIKRTIKNEYVRSIEEVKIANFLFLNGIEYEYETEYPYHIQNSKKPYTPDFTIKYNGELIYLEHFGITEDNKHSYYSKKDLDKYIQSINNKKIIHKIHKTKLLYTYSKYNDNVDFLIKLEELLISNNIQLVKRSHKDVYDKLIEDQDLKYFYSFIKLCMNFINNFKTSGYAEKDFNELKSNSNSERNKLFLDIVKPIYLYYQSRLATDGKIDFQDLINNSTAILESKHELNLGFKYIIVDEYQDISQQRFDLTKRLSEVTNAKIIAVGDDWQSIYAFSGSRLELFTKFKEAMGYANVLQITHTYRNSQELIDIAGEFIQENDSQIKKKLISPKSIKYPVAIFTYSDDQKQNKSGGKSGILEEKAIAIDKAIKTIIKRQQKDNSTILLLGRYGFDGSRLGKTSLFTYNEKSNKLYSNNYPNVQLTFMTAHSSKGLGFDDVIIINAEEGVYGFPTQIIDDPILRMVLAHDFSYEFAEERRLFYVSLTRTKNRVYIIVPKNNPSRFIIELLERYENIYVDNEEIEMEIKEINNNKFKHCPVCGFPIHLVTKSNYKQKMWACSNDPEVCDFLSNDLRGGKTRIRKCDKCKDGYLLIKKRRNVDAFFLGCSNYKSDSSGCDNSEQLDFDGECKDDSSLF